MRVTNSMMRTNSLLNMQKNKVKYSEYLMQYNTQKKIQRPSEDPTIAVRALKYRTTLVEINQYLDNIKDAQNWMDETETVLVDLDKGLDNMVKYVTQAATGTLNNKNRADIVEQLQQDCYYIFEQDLNTDYAGRYLFTGYRTDVALLFDEAKSDVTYTITEELDMNDISHYHYVYGGPEYDASKTANTYAGEASQFLEVYRIPLSYNNCDKIPMDSLTYVDENGVTQTVTVTMKKIEDDTKYNEHMKPGDNEVYYVPESGELLFGDSIYAKIKTGSNLTATYKKTEFEKTDVRPEHYFKCSTVDNTTGVTSLYNNAGSQKLNYQVNFSQVLQVNTEACNTVSLGIKRTIQNIENICDDITLMETKIASTKKLIEDCPETDTQKLADLNELNSQLETQLQLQTSVLSKALGAAITVCQKEKNNINVALASHGARYNRLTLTQSKLQQQKTDTEDAKSENEDADLGEAYINFSEADLLYQATLGATSKILGESLLNFI